MTSKHNNTFHDVTSNEVGAELAATGRTSASRPFLLIPGLAVLTGVIALAVRTGTPWWLVLVGFAAPDLAFVLAIGQENGAPGRIPRSAIAFYNMLHRTFTPLLVLLISALLHSAPAAIIALSWFVHILVDRAAGFGLRDRQGTIIPPKRIHFWRRGNPQ